MVRLIQVLCKNRHCIVAIAYEADNPDTKIMQQFKTNVTATIAAGQLNPYCAICSSREFTYEDERTHHATLEAAMLELIRLQHEQAVTAARLRASRN